MSNRRSFLKDTLSFGIGTIVLPKAFASIPNLFEFEQEFQSIELRSPEHTGLLTAKEAYILWSYFKFIGLYWDTLKFSNVASSQRFVEILTSKTSIRPSYLQEYRSAVSIILRNKDKHGNTDYETFLLKNTDEYSKKFVTLEFLNLNISSGGFKKFGYMNYAGYPGGRFDDPKHIPYRV